MNEAIQIETDESKRVLNDLAFRHNISDNDKVTFVSKHSAAEAVALIRECEAENDKRIADGKQPVKVASNFRQKARNYADTTKREFVAQKRVEKSAEWEEHIETVKASEYKPTSEQLLADIRDSSDSDEKKKLARQFLRRLYGEDAGDGQQPINEPEEDKDAEQK